jgi:hypothetical protein
MAVSYTRRVQTLCAVERGRTADVFFRSTPSSSDLRQPSRFTSSRPFAPSVTLSSDSLNLSQPQTRRTTRRSLAAAELGVENDLSNRVASRSTTAANANAGPSKPQVHAQKPVIAVTRRALTGKAVLGDKVCLLFLSRWSRVFEFSRTPR